ncbi:TonB-dependent receptor [Pseudochrobactrum sp. sp1633]|uniref:TonB-dependent receptor plug domain-containing protein n=1 Tax=Pseudochrobactrum sp. sp1633 TaxID=3036706 RepID=UPI0025A62EED|nr:TonB-dependent receptor [Pseudochrobactrum sp. sp1633]MDM8344277.1 TonB-dependent receptor [Pseudochrobactrum sp. sp1633]HWD14590.1 TonB-dependent receptor [Pseudochrobactrum sp.]
MTRNLLQHKKTILVLGTALTVFSLGHAFAEEKKQETVQLKEILVTAGRTPIEEGKTGRAVTVITGKQLEQNQVRYVADALRMVPGFAVSRTGSYGGLTQVRVRGAEANHLLVMIDGVEAGSPSDGEFDFGELVSADIDRIEILRGPQSAFWGSNALAGVVNIITKGGKRDGFKISGTTETGSHNAWLGGLLLQGGKDNYDMAFGASYRRTDGFNVSSFGNEKDGDENLTLNGKVNIDLSDTAKLDASLRYFNRTADNDGTGPWPNDGYILDTDEQSKTRELIGSIGLTWTALDEALTQKLRFNGSDAKRKNYDTGAYVSGNQGKRYTGTYQATYAFDTPAFGDAHHKITGGLEWKQERFQQLATEADLSSPWTDMSQFDEHKRSMYSFIGEYNGEFVDQFFVNLGLRHDVNKDFGDATTFSLSGAWAIPDTNARLHSSVGTGVANPTFYEQFGYIPNSFIGNPALKPEKSLGWDIGLEYAFFDGLVVTDITYFNQDLSDEIVGTMNSVKNLDGRSKRHGVELAATLNLFHGFTAGGSYTYTSSRDAESVIEVRRPRHSGSVNVAYTFYEDRARLFGEAVFNGKMDDNVFVTGLPPRLTLGSYTVVNIGGSYKFTDKLEGYARIENLFDKKYQEVYGYNTPGRGAFAGLKASF